MLDRKQMSVVALVLAAFACRADRITDARTTVVSARDAWSGGTLLLTSAAFGGADSMPVVTIGHDTLSVQSVRPESIAVQLIDTNGTVQLSVHLKSGVQLVDSVRVYGFVGAGAGPGPAVTGWLYPWPTRGAGTALGFQSGRLVLLDFGLKTSSPLAPDTGLGHGCLSGPVPSASGPGLVVVSSLVGSGTVGSSASCGPLIALAVGSGSAVPDTGPPPDAGWPSVHLSRGVWLIGHKYSMDIVVGSVPTGFRTTAAGIPCSQPAGFVVSPRGDRVVPGRCGAAGGVPVFGLDTAGAAYTVTAIRETWGGEFTAGGDTLFQAADDSVGQSTLLELDAASGRVLARVPIDEIGLDVRIDPNGAWIYVAGAAGGAGAPFVSVFDRTTLARVATLRIPAGAVYPLTGDFEMVSNARDRRLYLTINDRSAPVSVYTFDLMP